MPKRSEFKLLKRAVDALEVEGKDAVFWDRDLAGFGVRVHPTGKKVYVVQSRGPRGPKRVTLGRHGDISTDEARKQAAAVIDRIKRGEEPKPGPPVAELTVAGLAERFMRVYAGAHCKPGTVAKYRSILDNHVLRALGSMTVGRVGAAEISALHHRLRETPRMANTVVDVLSRMFTLAEAWELTPPGSNPCRGLRRYRMRPCERFLTPEEYRRLGRVLQEAEGTTWPPAVAAIRLLMLTGCRSSEILNLRWDEVDLEANELRLPDTKTGPRRISLSPEAAGVLAAIPRVPDNPFVILGKVKGRPMRNLNDPWEVVCERAGLTDMRIHDCRHSYASRALAIGESLPMIGRLLGHSQVETTARYAHLARDSVHEAAARISDSIAGDILKGYWEVSSQARSK